MTHHPTLLQDVVGLDLHPTLLLEKDPRAQLPTADGQSPLITALECLHPAGLQYGLTLRITGLPTGEGHDPEIVNQVLVSRGRTERR